MVDLICKKRYVGHLQIASSNHVRIVNLLAWFCRETLRESKDHILTVSEKGMNPRVFLHEIRAAQHHVTSLPFTLFISLIFLTRNSALQSYVHEDS